MSPFARRRILLGPIDRLEGILLDPIRAITADADAFPADRLSRILTHHLRVVLDHDSLPILLLAEVSASDDPRVVQRMRDIFNSYRYQPTEGAAAFEDGIVNFTSVPSVDIGHEFIKGVDARHVSAFVDIARSFLR